MPLPLRSLAVSALLCLPAAAALAQTTPAPDFRIGTQIRVLDVTVLDKHGRPITQGLSKDDFRIVDGKGERPILSFEANGSGSSIAPPRTVLVVDHLNSTMDQEEWEQHNVEKYLNEQPAQLPQATEIALLAPEGIQILQGFTTDKQTLLQVIPRLQSKVAYRLNGSWVSDNFNVTVNGLDEIALQVKGTPGRKNVVFIGTGGPGIPLASLNPTLEDHIRAYMKRAADELVDARISLFVITPDLQVGDTRYAGGKTPAAPVAVGSGSASIGGGGTNLNEGASLESSDVSFSTQSGTDALLAADTGKSDPLQDHISLGVIARLSGGTLFANRNDIANEVQESVALGTKYYTLSYHPDSDEKDGKFVPVRVALDKPGLHALTKKGYYSLNDATGKLTDEQQGQFDLRRAALSPITFSAVEVAAHAVRRYPDPHSSDQDTVTFSLMLRPADLTFLQTGETAFTGKILVGAVAVGNGHDIVASNMVTMAVKSGSLAGTQSMQARLPVEISVKVPKKTNHVRLVVRDTQSGRIGAFDIDKATAEATPLATGPAPVTPGGKS